MSFRPGLVVMMAAKRFLDLAEGLRSFGFCWPFPVERESLTAHTATGLNLLVTAFAKYLHFPDPLFDWPGGFPSPRNEQ